MIKTGDHYILTSDDIGKITSKDGVVTIPNKVTIIEKEAFAHNQDIKKVIVGTNVEVIEENAFKGCVNLEEVVFNSDTNLKDIGNNAFTGTKRLKKINIPNSTQIIGVGAFSGAESLISVKLPENITSIRTATFQDCYSLENVEFSNNISIIGDRAFLNTSLINLTLPKKVTEIGNSSFANCMILNTINLGNNLTSIGMGAFKNCMLLQNHTLPDTLISISNGAFENCSTLTKVVIPQKTDSVSQYAYKNCKNINTFIMPLNSKSTATKAVDRFEFNFLGDNGELAIFTNDPNYNYPPNTTVHPLFMYNSAFMDFDNKLYFFDHQDFIQLRYLAQKTYENKGEIPFELALHLLSTKKDRLWADQAVNYKMFKPVRKVLDQYKVPDITSFEEGIYLMGMALGAFNANPLISQKGSEFLRDKISSEILKHSDFVNIKDNIRIEGYKPEFASFVMDKSVFSQMRERDVANPEILSKIYNSFEEVQLKNTSHRGNQRQLKPVLDKFISHFSNNQFAGITEENRHISDELIKFTDSQWAFDTATNLMKKAYEQNVPNHILNNALTNNPLLMRINKIREGIVNDSVEIINNLNDSMPKTYTYEWLDKKHPANFTLGKYCSCCSHLFGVGSGIVYESLINPNLQNMVLRNKHNEIIAKSTLYVNPDIQLAVFNDIEVNENVKETEYKELLNSFLKGANDFITHYNLENPEKPLKQVNLGTGPSPIYSEVMKNLEETNQFVPNINFSLNKLNPVGGYINNSQSIQRIVWKNKELE